MPSSGNAIKLQSVWLDPLNTGGALPLPQNVMITAWIFGEPAGIEILVKAVSATNSDPTKDQRGCYKRGDIVLARIAGLPWGSEELKPPADGGVFVVIRITDVTMAEFRNFIQRKWGFNPDDPERDGNGNPTRRRRLNIDPQSLPVGVRNTLNTTGFYENTWGPMRQYFIDKVSGVAP